MAEFQRRAESTDVLLLSVSVWWGDWWGGFHSIEDKLSYNELHGQWETRRVIHPHAKDYGTLNAGAKMIQDSWLGLQVNRGSWSYGLGILVVLCKLVDSKRSPHVRVRQKWSCRRTRREGFQVLFSQSRELSQESFLSCSFLHESPKLRATHPGHWLAPNLPTASHKAAYCDGQFTSGNCS